MYDADFDFFCRETDISFSYIYVDDLYVRKEKRYFYIYFSF
ncbi:hypothetical protein P689_12255 [Candidatus Riesia pediculischaeffi PTSU]|uniref:Uncharacterized protein n=1 Tax=Candidatus Riesia pediculischaeffi PTSU TaxID=1401651 RepID=A0A0C1S9E3_9ENTR|nr:hypothetical protein P689_12255 [Candidatus Riesia pediculischaeffi PTSU]